MTEDEFIGYIAWAKNITVEQARQWWDSLPEGSEVCSLALGCVTKEAA